MTTTKPSIHKQSPEKMLEAIDDANSALGLKKAKLRTPKEYADLLYPEVKRDPRMQVLVYCHNKHLHQNKKRKPVETRVDYRTGMTERVECPECNQWIEPRGKPNKVRRVDSGMELSIRRI